MHRLPQNPISQKERWGFVVSGNEWDHIHDAQEGYREFGKLTSGYCLLHNGLGRTDPLVQLTGGRLVGPSREYANHNLVETEHIWKRAGVFLHSNFNLRYAANTLIQICEFQSHFKLNEEEYRKIGESAMKTLRTAKYLQFLILLFFLLISGESSAGDLEPTAPPGPTMKTLDQIAPRIPISSVPFTIASSGSYYLTSNLSSTTDGITINADGVTIDLMGYIISGQKSGGLVRYGIYMNNRKNVEIRNGTVEGFRNHGIYAVGTESTAIRVMNVRAIDNGEAGVFLHGNGHLIKDCTAVGNDGLGLGCYTGTIMNNTVYNNGESGIDAGSSCTVVNNTSLENGQIGIEVTNFGMIANNNTRGNGIDGIKTNSSTVVGNISMGNFGDGIQATGLSTVFNNTVAGNGDFGLNLGSNSGYAYNALADNNGGNTNPQVSGGIELGENVCGTDKVCP